MTEYAKLAARKKIAEHAVRRPDIAAVRLGLLLVTKPNDQLVADLRQIVSKGEAK